MYLCGPPDPSSTGGLQLPPRGRRKLDYSADGTFQNNKTQEETIEKAVDFIHSSIAHECGVERLRV
jgi:hypothetical protein